MASLAERDVIDEFEKHCAYFLENITEISRKQIRRYLEEKIGLEVGDLDSYKHLISGLCVELVQSAEAPGDDGKHGPEGPSLSKSKNAGQRAQRTEGKENASEEVDSSMEGSLGSESEELSRPAKRPRAVGGDKARNKPCRQTKAASKPATSSSYGQRITKLQKICKSATIAIPPNTYHGKDEDLIYERLLELLGKHDLDSHSSAVDIQRAREGLQKQRDLDGLDMSNIIEGRPRRGAAASAVATVSRYASIMKTDDSDDSEEEAKTIPPR
eukprot:CAMPEP_0117668684 /NCGR_PEP_ID=MMETSP0804-20121206/11691_1 /TAXON_ID=1074897 /ORGANISM="Tetraselmis astigmatica, Strain CCMP880" /LENGTH=270 /DNA_ID=CAMNT_0005476613 /DNA_START=254 /DNA_END=1067 /DNA_ORIENTATION=+